VLTLLGGGDEAWTLLSGVKNLDRIPQVEIAKAWSCFERWEYEESIPFLKRYLEFENDPYRRSAGFINLAEAYIFSGRQLEASNALDLAFGQIEKSNHRLLANAYHVRAQLHFEAGRISHSDRDVAAAKLLFGTAPNSDSLLIERQAAINAAFRENDLERLVAARKKFQELRSWENVRELDFRRLSFRSDSRNFRHLYWGTPYPAFRKRMETTYGLSDLGGEYYWKRKHRHYLNLQTGDILRGRESVSSLTKQNRVLVEALTRDFYSPPSINRLFQRVFPGEPFHFDSSPARVRQAIKRLRKSLVEDRIPLSLSVEHGTFNLILWPEFSIRLESKTHFADRRPSELQTLVQRFSEQRVFTTQEACEALNAPKTTVLRVLADAIRTQRLRREGIGRSTKYRLIG
jgi:tetratricopeptide (TPR) repeat protein